MSHMQDGISQMESGQARIMEALNGLLAILAANVGRIPPEVGTALTRQLGQLTSALQTYQQGLTAFLVAIPEGGSDD